MQQARLWINSLNGTLNASEASLSSLAGWSRTVRTGAFPEQLDGDGNANFTLKAKGSWSNANLVALCPVSQWDAVFASQVDSVITNPPAESTPDNSFNVPS